MTLEVEVVLDTATELVARMTVTVRVVVLVDLTVVVEVVSSVARTGAATRARRAAIVENCIFGDLDCDFDIEVRCRESVTDGLFVD